MNENLIFETINNSWDNIKEDIIEEGKRWYYDKHLFCKELSDKYKTSFLQTVGIYAALSPMKSVSENDRLCEKFLKGFHEGHFTTQVDKCKTIKKAYAVSDVETILKGDKTVAFFNNIYNPYDKKYVCVDRHMIKIFNNGILIGITPKRYRTISNGVKSFSKTTGLIPNQTQAILWLHTKDKSK